MSVISGGIFSKPRGKTGGIVFGAARTRQGKLATARELVKPSNPNTSLQQTQRSKFKSALDLVKRIGSTIYRTDWNRSVGQLPGFQSMLSIFLNQMDASKDLILTHDVNLGTLSKPDNLAFASPSAGQIKVSWHGLSPSKPRHLNEMVVIFINKDDAKRSQPDGVLVDSSKIRMDTDVITTQFATGDTVEIYIYERGVGQFAGLYTPAFHGSVTVS